MLLREVGSCPPHRGVLDIWVFLSGPLHLYSNQTIRQRPRKVTAQIR